MAANTPFMMSLVPILGAAISFFVFSLLMIVCIRHCDEKKQQAKRDDLLDEETHVAVNNQIVAPSS